MMRAAAVICILILAVSQTCLAQEVYCADGRYLNGESKCTDCPAGCNQCNLLNGGPNCFDCSGKKVFELSGAGAKCIDCVTGCSTCKGPEPKHCLSTEPGYFADITANKVYECPNRCRICSDKNKCTHCRFGYFLDGDDCKPCSAGCAICTKDACTTCGLGYAMAEDKTCKSCSVGCLDCTTTACTMCKGSPDRYVLGDGKCKICPSQCKECSPDGKCSSCNKGSFVKDGDCISCEALSKGSCSACSADQCLECDTGSSLVGGKCVACPANCKKCETESKCSECHPFAKKDGDNCVRTQIIGCEAIAGNDVAKCSKCKDRLRLKADGTECQNFNCEQGKGPDTAGQCVNCMSNCYNCDMDKKTCFRTASGYYFDGKAVQACPKGCHTCGIKNGNFECELTLFDFFKGIVGKKTPDNRQEGGYFCHETCSACLFPNNQTACIACMPGLIGATTYKKDFAFCIDLRKNPKCPKPFIGSLTHPSSDYCLGADAPNTSPTLLFKKVLSLLLLAAILI